jgi:hypothetical protein
MAVGLFLGEKINKKCLTYQNTKANMRTLALESRSLEHVFCINFKL